MTPGVRRVVITVALTGSIAPLLFAVVFAVLGNWHFALVAVVVAALLFLAPPSWVVRVADSVADSDDETPARPPG